MPKRDVILLTEQFRSKELLQVVQQIESLGYACVWLLEPFRREPFASAGFLLANTQGMAIANVYAREAVAPVQASCTLAELLGGRLTLVSVSQTLACTAGAVMCGSRRWRSLRRISITGPGPDPRCACQVG